MSSSAQSLTPERLNLERKAAATLELRSRENARRNAQKTVYGIYQPNGEYGGELVKCLQESNGEYVEVDSEPAVMVPAKLERFLTTKKRFKIAFGGRSGAKSNTFGDIFASKAKDYGEKTLCLREMQGSIEDSVHALLSTEIERLGYTDFEVTDKHIKLKGRDVFKFKGMYRDTEAVKSAFGFKQSWVEEAQSCSEKSLSDLTPTIRQAGSELWFSLNPGSSADPMSQRFLQPFYTQLLADGYYEDDLHLIVWINYDDNPWHSSELEQERLYDQRVLSPAKYRHKWEGHYDDEVDNSIIPVEWFDAAIDAHLDKGFKGEGALVASYDPSDLGPDAKGYALRHGSVVLDIRENEQGDANEGTDWAIDLAIKSGADCFVWDCDGLGVSLKRQVDKALKGKKIDYVMFRGSESPEDPEADYIPTDELDNAKRKTNKDTFKNKRAQYYVRLRDRFHNTYLAVVKGDYVNPDDMLSLSSEIACIDQLRAEVCRIPLKKGNNNGKIQIMSKVEMSKKPYQIASPNMADALMMSMHRPEAAIKPVKINYKGWG